MTRRRITTAATAAALASVVSTAGAQQVFPQTLLWGAGLIDIPVAWVSPVTGDFALTYSGQSFKKFAGTTNQNFNRSVNSHVSASLSLFGRMEVGVSAYTLNPELGGFGQVLLLDEEMFRRSHGIARLLPGVAVGVRNVGPFDKIDRFGLGYSLRPNAANPTAGNTHDADTVHQNFKTANTVYGVATKSFSLSDMRSGWSDINLSFSLGVGNGLFKDDGKLGKRYAAHKWNGLFGGAKMDFTPSPNTSLAVMAENDGWEYNLGASVDYRGLRLGAYLTDLGSSVPADAGDEKNLYNYSKFAFQIGWQSNTFALLRGDFLKNRVAELEKQRDLLLAEISTRQTRISGLQSEINRYEAQNLLELEQRRSQADAELRAEREALQRLEERLKRLETQVPPTSPPPAKPPVE